MQTVLGGTMNIPFQLPESFENHEQYRAYLAFRVQLQMLSSLSDSYHF